MAQKVKVSQKKEVFLFFILLLTLSACGKNTASKPANSLLKEPAARPVIIKEEIEEEVKVEADDQGFYKAILSPVNSSISFAIKGTFTINIDVEDVIVESEVSGLPGGIKHFQTIHEGAVCPDENADLNFDGVIDETEGVAIYGPSLLPLDSSLHSQMEGITYGPISNEEGQYFYRRSTFYSWLMADLAALDHDLEDHLVKLASGDKLNLSNRVVVVYGTSSDIQLPDTVRSIGELTPHQALPIACGKFVLDDQQVE